MKKSLFLMFSIISVGALAACNSQGGTPVNIETANTTMVRAMANMSNMSVGSMHVNLATDTAVSVDHHVAENDYDYYNSAIDFALKGAIDFKLSDLWGAAPKAHLNVDIDQASLVMSDDVEGEFANQSLSDASLNAYYANDYAYIDLSGAASLLELIFSGEVPNDFPTKIKQPVGSVAELEIPDMTDPSNALPQSEVDGMVAEMVPMLMLMPNATATTVGNELRIVYTLTQANLPALVQSFLLQLFGSFEQLPSSLTPSMQAELDLMVAEIVDAIDLNTFRVEVRVNTTRNILTYFQMDIDVVLTIEDYYDEGYWDDVNYEWVDVEVPFTTTVDIDTTTTLQILKFSEAVTITLPGDLNTYVEPENPQPVLI